MLRAPAFSLMYHSCGTGRYEAFWLICLLFRGWEATSPLYSTGRFTHVVGHNLQRWVRFALVLEQQNWAGLPCDYSMGKHLVPRSNVIYRPGYVFRHLPGPAPISVISLLNLGVGTVNDRYEVESVGPGSKQPRIIIILAYFIFYEIHTVRGGLTRLINGWGRSQKDERGGFAGFPALQIEGVTGPWA